MTETKVTIWKVRGLYGAVFASKLDAEVAAREEFPHENPDLRYSRIHYVYLQGTYVSLRELAHATEVAATKAKYDKFVADAAQPPGEITSLGQRLRKRIAEEELKKLKPDQVPDDTVIYLLTQGRVGGNDD